MSVQTVDDYCKVLKREIHLSNETITAFSSHAKGLWKSPRGTLIRIEFLVVLATLFFLILNGFGRYRRRSRNFFIQKGVLGAFTLSSSLMTYTLGSMQSSSVKSSMYSIWAISLFLLHGCTDSITAHTLRDNTEIRKLMFQAILYNLYGGFLIISGPIGILWKFVLFYYLYVLSIFKFAQRLFAYGLATGSCNIYKTVSDYMYQEHKMGGLFDPATMEGCHYLVDWPMGKSKLDNETCAREITADQSEVIDLEKIWLCRSLDPELKYECLSFSLFHLLRRRAFGFACGESKIKAHDFVFKGLLLDATNDYSRVFKVIETELAFMYDVYFTKYAVLYYRSRTATVWYLVSVTSICLTIYAVATHVGKYDCTRTQELSFIVDTKADVTITLVILACAGVLESVQMLVFWTSVWGRVSFACQHIREEKTTTANRRGYMMMMRLKGLLANIGLQCESKKNCWQHQLGQYSLIGAVGNIIDRSVAEPRPLLRSVMLTALPFPVLDQSSWQASAVRRYERMPTKLRSQVKKAVVDSLVRTQGKLTSGRSSLVDNGAGYLSWACEWDVHPETTCIILTWHIATCYCEMMVTSPGGAETSPSVHYDVATVLSGYCAHLVVSEPKLLPGHHHDTTSVFNGAAEEAMNFLQGATNRYEAMKNVMVLPPTVFGRGVKLGKQLEGMLEDTRWKVLADFWAEMLLYAAPSDNVNEHIEKLAYGGEFITHLWALLSHAASLSGKTSVKVDPCKPVHHL